jgi:hypothetical protein
LAAISCDSNVTLLQSIGAADATTLSASTMTDTTKIRFAISNIPPRERHPGLFYGLSYTKVGYTPFE